jgi:uncharacterized protein
LQLLDHDHAGRGDAVKIKSVGCQIKAAGAADGLKAGEFQAIVSVFGNRDSYGDIMVPGAFIQTLAAWASSGDPIPVIWSHDWLDPMSHMGEVLDAKEVPAAAFSADSPPGLWVHGSLDITDNTKAAQVSKLLNGRRVKQFSFAFDETDSGPGTYNGQDGWLIRGVNLFEVGPTLLGANQETQLVGAKSGGPIDLATRSKAGSRHSTADLERLNAIHGALVELGVSCGEKSAPTPPAGQDVPSGQTKTNDRQDGAAGDVDRATGDVDDVAALLAVVEVEEIMSAAL